MQLCLLGPDDEFPDPSEALEEPNGLLAVGADLSVKRLVAAYQRGIFPWFTEEDPILWWSPTPRTVFIPDQLHLSKSTFKYFRKQNWFYSINQDFDAVVDACATTRKEGTWITDDMRAAYRDFHDAGYATSIEIWDKDNLIGGLYGVLLGRAFFGESMVSLATNGSKAALLVLQAQCIKHGIELIDCQVESDHLMSLGATLIDRDDFTVSLTSLTCDSAPTPWYAEASPLQQLLRT